MLEKHLEAINHAGGVERRHPVGLVELDALGDILAGLEGLQVSGQVQPGTLGTPAAGPKRVNVVDVITELVAEEVGVICGLNGGPRWRCLPLGGPTLGSMG